jgi:hypothetical protein
VPAVRLDTLRTNVRQLADMERSRFIQDPELTRVVNRALWALDDLLYSMWMDYRLTVLPFTFSADTYELPADFYKLRSLDVYSDGEWRELSRAMWKERNTLRNAKGLRPEACRYQLTSGNQVRILPGFSGRPVQAEAAYYPQRPALADDADTVVYPHGWEHAAELAAAIYCLTKEQRDPGTLPALLAAERQRITEAAPELDGNDPQRVVVTDVDEFPGIGDPLDRLFR